MIYAAFTIGLLGSLHCLGMCGPIAFALPVRTTNPIVKGLKYLLYNLGRVFTYASLGLIIGFAGKGFALAGLQQGLSIATGILILLSVFFIHYPMENKWTGKLSETIKRKLKSSFHHYFNQKGWSALFILGLLNGLLPCGMVYTAMVGALAAGSHWEGAMFMAAFGAGTIPLMMAISLTGNMMTVKIRQVFHKVTPVVACMVAILLILRGLNLDIPYISPTVTEKGVHKCH